MDSTNWQWKYNGTQCTTDVWTGGSQEGPIWLGIHGFTGTGADFESWFNHLSPELNWEAPDLPGHGRWLGPRDPELCSMEACVAMLEARIEAASRPVIVVGYSLGGRVALNFAARRSHLIKGLVLIGANPGIREERLRHERLRWEAELCQRLRDEGVEDFMSYWQSLPIINTQNRIPDHIRLPMRERRLLCNPEGLTQSLRTMGTGSMVSLWDALPNIECPVLYCAGEEDQKYCSMGQEVVEQLPHGQFAALAGAGHAAHLEAIEASGKAVLNWYRGL